MGFNAHKQPLAYSSDLESIFVVASGVQFPLRCSCCVSNPNGQSTGRPRPKLENSSLWMPNNPLSRFLIQHAPRWEDLDLELAPELLLLLVDLRGRVHLLQRLWIGWRSGPPGAIQPIDCFRDAPSLLNATVNPHWILFPLDNLTRSQLECPWDIRAF
ncbi:hypothetical protein C8F04DRAFT_475288 [Mycena alexandri]|uniref:Uncharacterized protein n=1 Tax=Mycena alexandri TaxID=1745969 RepID=A0AAD6SZ11_9AGAR|nr:hypothetical protein C8F04DRAFT_475288 [Mycena alexandri]